MEDCIKIILTYLNKYDLFIMKFVNSYYNKLIIINNDLYIFDNIHLTITIIQYFKIKKFTTTSFNGIVKIGNLDIMKWLKNHGCTWDSNTFTCAAEFGNLEKMKWILENK